MLILYIFPIEAWDWVIFKYKIFRHFIKKKFSLGQIPSFAEKHLFFRQNLFGKKNN